MGEAWGGCGEEEGVEVVEVLKGVEVCVGVVGVGWCGCGGEGGGGLSEGEFAGARVCGCCGG